MGQGVAGVLEERWACKGAEAFRRLVLERLVQEEPEVLEERLAYKAVGV